MNKVTAWCAVQMSFICCMYCVTECSMWAISEVLHTVRFLSKNEFILQNTFTGLQCNLCCALSQRSNVWASLVFLSGSLRFWCVLITRVTSLDTSSMLLKRFSRNGFFNFGTSQRLVGSCQDCTAGGEELAIHNFPKFPILHLRHVAAR